MENTNPNEELSRLAYDNIETNHEVVEGESHSKSTSIRDYEIISVPEERVPTGKSEANLKNKKNTRKKGIFPMYRKISDIEPKPINWLWEDYMAKGTITLITGEPELGKSQITLNMAATVTTGGIWPDNRKKQCKIGNVILISAEDSLEHTIRTRLEANSANMDKIYHLDGIGDYNSGNKLFNLKSNLNELETMINDIKGVSMIVIDPLSAFIAGVDSYKNTDVRSMLAPLSKLAEKYDIAIVGVEHPPKSSNGKAINQVGGSKAFIAAARSAYLVSKDPQDEKRSLFLRIKNNLTSHSVGISFRLEEVILPTGEISKVVWGDEPVKITADEVLAYYNRTEFQHGKESRTKWLQEELADGPKKVKDVMEEAQRQGIGKKQLRNLRKGMGIESNKTSFKGGYEMSLPDSSNIQEPEDALLKKGAFVE
jgi:putative DNA primase/helicase